MLIRKSEEADSAAMLAIVNDAAQAYRGVIPADQWREPYMPLHELEKERANGIIFLVAEEDQRLLGVMGIQDKGDVALVRHAYVTTAVQRKGVGTRLLRHAQTLMSKPVLIGTWATASWAIEFYRRNGFTVVPDSDKDFLLRRYWSIPERQIETSVILADGRWMNGREDHKMIRTLRGLAIGSAMGVFLSCASTGPTPAGKAEGLRAPTVMQRVDPKYPVELRQQGVQGVVVISGTVPKEGGVLRNPRVVRTDDPRLNQLALDAVSRWLWRAGLQNGEAVDVEFTTDVRFDMKQ